MRGFCRFGFDAIFCLFSEGGPVGDPSPTPNTDPIAMMIQFVAFLDSDACVVRKEREVSSVGNRETRMGHAQCGLAVTI